jgi:redox-sensitive bicupin YhaK (pirin superfamily)
VAHELAAGHLAWVQVAKGSALFNGEALEAGDGAAVDVPGTLEVEGVRDTEVLLFDMAS